ncbi:tetratricopeptide repeat protein [Croceitalea sp. MTPC9]|uniref:hypothetical protein n=1 Tax=unclassified Croceitalea TaxID=2632280 RepID=UPI002B396D52|nr:tetratricopeptide repeat protein [Croceitalea sp. MTPC6]GMN17083.1 tetratricopeptide repeat protein [Croceitalea sp. MTPC9]
MNVSDFIHILQKSDTILSPKQTRELEGILEEYPYFQAARALHLKGLKNLDSYKYNNALKVTAAHTADREVLFDYITSKEFTQNSIANSILGRTEKLEEKETISEEITPNPETEVFLGEVEEKSPLPQNIKDAEQILDPALFESKTGETPNPEEIVKDKEGLQLGKPLPFTKSEKHSFAEWLQLATPKPILREGIKEENELQKKKKFELLDKFIETKPKIVPNKESEAKVNIEQSVKIDKNQLMTETLAKVYLEQKKYKKAIQAFKILSLKYPEKSGFFADQIRRVRNLQKDKD